MNKEESAKRIEVAAAAMSARYEEIATAAKESKQAVWNIFTPRESRKTVRLVQDFIAAIARSSSMSAVTAARPTLQQLEKHTQMANAAVSDRLPPPCRNLIACIAAGEQFYLNLLLRNDRTALSLAKLLRPIFLPLRELLLICSRKLFDQLSVGC